MPKFKVTVTIEDTFEADGWIKALNLFIKALGDGEYIYRLHNPKVEEVK